MVHRIDHGTQPESLRSCLAALTTDYELWLAEGVPPEEADRRLTERGVLAESVLLALYAEYCGVALFEEESGREPECFSGIRVDYLELQGLLPLHWSDAELVFLAAAPYQLERQRYELEQFFSPRQVHFLLARRTLIERLLNQLYHGASDEPGGAGREKDERELRQLAGEARIVRLVNEMFAQAIERSASDIHVEPEGEALAIRFRIDGELWEHLHLPLTDAPAIASRIKLIGNLNIAESRLPQDGRTDFVLGGTQIDIRISTIPVMNGESIVMRLLRKESMRFDLRELGMGAQLRSVLERMIAAPHGIILVVGPTGSGKTTTLYSAMQQLNDHRRKIITIEDPVEYQLPGLCQMQVNHKIGLTFASGLRHIVRQDPDVILVGEIRDRETADIAINAALTGHLVFSTLHTNDAVGAIARLLDMGVEGFLIASAVTGVLSQRLVRKICPECRGTGEVAASRCRNCNGSGYRGRTGIYELLTLSNSIRRAIVERWPGDRIAELAAGEGMVSLLEDGKSKEAAGITSAAEIARVASGVC